MQDLVDQHVSLGDGTKDVVACLLLSPRVHLVAILLINKGHSDVLHIVKAAVLGEYPFACIAEGDVANVQNFHFALGPRRHVLAGAHGKEETDNG